MTTTPPTEEPVEEAAPVQQAGVGASAPDDRLQITLPIYRSPASPPH